MEVGAAPGQLEAYRSCTDHPASYPEDVEPCVRRMRWMGVRYVSAKSAPSRSWFAQFSTYVPSQLTT